MKTTHLGPPSSSPAPNGEVQCGAALPSAISPTWDWPAETKRSEDWPQFWDYVHTWMKQQGYAHSTARLYRQVLRNFARVADTKPCAITRAHIDHYFSGLGRGHCSAHWTAINLSTLRTMFDRVFGLDLLTHLTGPRRPSHLPEILNHEEALALLDAATTMRDRLLIGLLYGCGLTVGELRRLRWRDLDPDTMILRAPGNLQILPRTVRLPDALLPLVETARAQCPPDTWVLPGAREGRALSTRWIEFLTSETARRAGILKPVTPRTLRDTYAVQCLETGTNIRELQTVLGHRSVRTTLRYTRCMLPPGAISPLDRELNAPARPLSATPSATLQSAKLNPTPRLLEQVSSASEFLCLLRMQLGKRIFSRRRATGPP